MMAERSILAMIIRDDDSLAWPMLGTPATSMAINFYYRQHYEMINALLIEEIRHWPKRALMTGAVIADMRPGP